MIRCRSVLEFCFALMMLLFACPDVAPAQSRVALIIGNSSYLHAPILPHSVKDAEDIAGAFERNGFRTIRAFNASFDEFRQGIRNFNELTRAAEIAVVFYTGYGMEIRGENWLLPIDAELRTELDVLNETISLNVLMQSVGRASSLGVIILDASRNNPLASKLLRVGQSRAVSRGLTRVEPAQNVVVAYAAKEGTIVEDDGGRPRRDRGLYRIADGTTAEDDGGRTSPYTAALLKYLEWPSMDINLMFRKVRDDVMAQTNRRQRPFVYGSLPPKPIYLKEGSVVLPAETKDNPVPADEAVWQTIRESSDPKLFRQFMAQFPGSPDAEMARTRLAALESRPGPNINVAGDLPRRADGGVDDVHQCDRLAASPLDKDRLKKVVGVELTRIDVATAQPACEEAMRNRPQVARFVFQAGRIALARHDFAAALQLHLKASALGSTLAMYSLGLIYAEGRIVNLDYAEARRWYEKAVTLNLPFAMSELGVLCENGLGGPTDLAKALSLYRKAAAAGDRTSMTRIGFFYETGLAVRQDYAQALRWYRKSAELGDEVAMKQLGKLYEVGHGVSKSSVEARKWYELAAAKRGR